MTALIERLRRRKLFQWTLAYLAGGWVLLQVLQFLTATYEWSPLIVRVAPIMLVAGLFTVLVLAWYHGERGAQRATLGEAALIALTLSLGVAASVLVVRRSRPAAAIAHTSQVAEQSIAVLPFVNMSGSAENEYFSDGITEEILNALAKVAGLHVAARTSSFAFKGKNEDIAEIGRKLRVAHVLEGSVQRVGDRARITAQLINVETSYHLWSVRYDRDLKDIFAVEDEIARAIAAKLEAQFSPGVSPTVAPANVDAHDFYLLGIQSWSRRNLPSLRKATSYFEQAIALDSTFAAAHAGLALTLAVLPLYDFEIGENEAATVRVHARGKAAAARALSLNSNQAEAHAALGQIADTDDDEETAEQHLRAALRLSPNYATAHQWLAETLQFMGRRDEAVAEARRAVALDPLSPLMHAVLGKVLIGTSDPEGAIRSLQQSMQLDSQFYYTAQDLGYIALETKRYDIAREALRTHFARIGLARDAADIVVDGIEQPGERPALTRFLADPRNRNKLRSFTILVYELAGERQLALESARHFAALGNRFLRRQNRTLVNRFLTIQRLSQAPGYPVAWKD